MNNNSIVDGNCRFCGSGKVSKHGLSNSGYQRFSCLSCGKRSTTLADGIKYRVQDSRGCKPETVIPEEPEVEFKKKLPKGTRYIVTCAQNATPVHKDFVRSLQQLARKRGAQLIVVPMRYQNPTSIYSNEARSQEWYAPEILPYLHNTRMQINENLILLGDAKVVATAVRPLTGFESITGSCSGIVGHPKIQMNTIATPQNKLPKIMITTGACTLRNYTDSKSGKRAEFDHSLGALYVEVKGRKFNIRQINATKDGTFIDLNDLFTPTKVKKAPQVEALVLGDSHLDFISNAVVKATFEGSDSIISQLKPKVLAWHDLIDFYSRNHHHRNNPFTNICKGLNNRENVLDELKRAAKFIDKHVPKTVQNVFVPSNHPDALARWMREADWKTDPSNAEFYLETALAMLRSAKIDESGTSVIDPFNWWMDKLLKGNNHVLLNRDKSYIIKDIELGLHGDAGANGSRGSIVGFSKLGVKSISGHSHTPRIEGGAYCVGTSSNLKLEYSRGPSSWLNAHVVIYGNGKRSMIFIINGNWKLY